MADIEIQTRKYDEYVAKKVLNEFIKRSKRNDLSIYVTGYSITDLYEMYAYIRGSRDEGLFLSILNKYHFNYSYSVLNSIGSLLGKDMDDNPLEWPGIINYDNDGAKYILHTLIGDIEVFKASELFKNTSCSYIFDKELTHQCFYRTYDFVKENNDYDLVSSLISNSFRGGFYHAYARKGDILVDPAINAIYFNRDTISKLYKGMIIDRMSYSIVKEKFDGIKHRSNMDDTSTLIETLLPNLYR